ncbi:MAG: helix-turn-helix domain-containing protein [Bacteroidota bacterium]
MNVVKAIKSEKDYLSVLSRLENIFDAKPGTAHGNEAELLVILIEDYERRNCFIAAPSPVEAIRFRMEQMNLKQQDIAKYLGSETRVSEILNGRRNLTIDMIIALHHGLNIPFDSLITPRKLHANKIRYSGNVTGKKLSSVRERKIIYSKKKR